MSGWPNGNSSFLRRWPTDVHDVGHAVVAVIPDVLEDVGSGHDLPCVVHEELQERELAWAKFDLATVTLHQVAGGIDHDARCLQDGGPFAGPPADQRT